MTVKCLAQEHNAVPQPGLELGRPPDPESSALTLRPPRLPIDSVGVGKFLGKPTCYICT